MALIDGGRILAKALKKEGVDQIFGLIGYLVSPVFVGCSQENIRLFDVRHEQAAVHMADGYSQTTGKPGVAVIIGGPGFTNAVSAILKAYFSHTPLVVITGSFDPSKRDNGGLQDLDQLTTVRHYIKWGATVNDLSRIPEYVSAAFRNAVNGRRGPTVIEIPINILMNKCEEETIVWHQPTSECFQLRGNQKDIATAIDQVEQSQRPILIAGNGVFYSKGSGALTRFVNYTGIPTFTVNAGRGCIPDDHPLFFGVGRALEAGNQLFAFKRADLMIVVGSSIDYSMFFGKPPLFNPQLKIVQVDVDPCEIGKSGRKIDVGIVGHSRSVLEDMLADLEKRDRFGPARYANWVSELRENEKKYLAELSANGLDRSKGIDPYELLTHANRLIPRESILVLDGSNAMFWSSLLLKTYLPGHNIIGPSGTYGPMGTGLGLALGAKVAHPDKPVILYTGDGSLGFDINEFHTAIKHKLPVIVIIHNDQAWGFCRLTQKTLYPDCDYLYGTELDDVRYENIAKSYGGQGLSVRTVAEFQDALSEALKSSSLFIINVCVSPDALSPGAKFLSGAHKSYKEFA